MEKVIMLTGASSGMGLATARLLAKNGYTVETSDILELPIQHERIHHQVVDITQPEKINEWVKATIQRHQRIDGLITFAGKALRGAVEETSLDEAKQLFELNFFASANLANAVLPIMRKQSHGRIIFVSSGAALVAQPFCSWYSASKAALKTLAEGMRFEVKEFGVEITTLLPGWTNTHIFNKALDAKKPKKEYQQRRKLVEQQCQNYLENGQDPSVVANKVLSILKAKTLKPNYHAGKEVRQSALAKRLLPEIVYEKIIRQYYWLDKAIKSSQNTKEL